MSQIAAQELSQRASLINMNDSTPQDGNRSSTDSECYRHATGYIYDTDSDAPLIAQLPAEILILIFEQGHAEWKEPISFSHPVSSVCRYWRTLAIGTPSLWSPIRFRVGEHLDYQSRVRLYLERSKVFPVEISVGGGLEERLTDDDDFIMRHLSHCRSLTLQMDHANSLYPNIKRWGSRETPLLESLHLSNLAELTGENPWFPPPPQALFSSPNLHTVYMDWVELDRIDATQYFDLVNVADFTFRWVCQKAGNHEWLPGGTAVETFLSEIVEGMPKLRHLQLKCHFPDPPNAIIFPLLNSLHPSLTSLKLECISIAWGLQYGDWRCRDFSGLRELRLSFRNVPDPLYSDVFTLLGITPNLKELYFHQVHLLQIPGHGQAVRPVRLARLESITLKWAGKRTIETFFQTLVTPALNTATFTADPNSLSQFDPDNPEPTEAIPEFWRSCAQVQSITLRHCNISKNIDLLTTLRDVFRNIRNLDLGGNSEWDDGLLRGLGTSPWPCPHLETVAFWHLPDLTQDALESFLRARKRGSLAGECAEIKGVAMRDCPGLRETAALREIVENVWHPWVFNHY